MRRLHLPRLSADWLLIGFALTACVPCLLFPISNPDIFWHLSAARRMIELGSIPAYDWLSFNGSGLPWTDFEWLTQLIYLAIHHLLGMAGLWLYKGGLLIAAGAVLWKTFSVYDLPRPYRAAALSLWAAAQFARADIRPELYSIIGFGLVFLVLEVRRLGRWIPGPLWSLPVFSLWTNLHLGSVYGILLILIYAVADLFQKVKIFREPHAKPVLQRDSLGWYALWALAGTLIQPFAWRLFDVLWQHWREMGAMGELISEWRPIQLDNPWHWPCFALLFLSFGAAAVQVARNRSIALGPLAALLYFGFAASQHARLAGYFITIGVPLLMVWLKPAKLLPAAIRNGRIASGIAIAAACSYSFWAAHRFGAGLKIFNDRFVPVEAARFLADEKESLSRLPMYNEWGWGGYLGFKLYPEYRIFQDGRYIFHPLLRQAAESIGNPPDSWQEFLDRYEVRLAVMERLPLRITSTRLYPDGSTRPFSRPYYITFMPKERWALVHWDSKAVVFVRRDSVPARWLSGHEYRFLLPGDEEAMSDSLSRGEIPEKILESERKRHADETAHFQSHRL